MNLYEDIPNIIADLTAEDESHERQLVKLRLATEELETRQEQIRNAIKVLEGLSKKQPEPTASTNGAAPEARIPLPRERILAVLRNHEGLDRASVRREANLHVSKGLHLSVSATASLLGRLKGAGLATVDEEGIWRAAE